MNRKQSRTVRQDEPFAQPNEVDDVAARLDAIGEPTRRAILDLLRRRPSSVAELAAQLPISRPAVSQHLKVLRDAGLVQVQARGTRRIYALDPDGTAALQRYVTSLWDAALDNLGRTAARPRSAPR
jgi:DNA-binding transcriptional ArsR family regulator